MASYLICEFFRKNIDFGDSSNLNIVGQIFFKILNIISIILFFIVMIPLAIFENLFIIPIWLGYNLFHKKENRKGYIQFLNFD